MWSLMHRQPVKAGEGRWLPVTAGEGRWLPVTAGVGRWLPVTVGLIAGLLAGCTNQSPTHLKLERNGILAENLSGDIDLKCLTRRMDDCLQTAVPRNEPHGAVCSTCHNMWPSKDAAHSVRSCSGSGCHEQPEKLSPFHRTVKATTLNNCTHCHVAHDFRVPSNGTQCLACHRSGGEVIAWAGNPKELAPLPKEANFWHSDHNNVACAQCHGSSNTHGSAKVTAIHDCETCHHSQAKGNDCMRCHSDDKVFKGAFRVETKLNIKIGSLNQPTRSLLFEHTEHQQYGCATCHKTGTTVPTAKGADCSSCHLQHHDVNANCAACHEPPAAGAHNRNAHLGCTGAGCHQNAPAALRAAPRARNVCLACHADRANHEPGGTCSDCHLMAKARPAGTD